jgi:signal transduction histidine kinase
MLYRQNLLRMLSGVIWITVPLLALLLLLPHQENIAYGTVFSLLFLILVMNTAAMLLQLRETVLNRYFGPLAGCFSVALIALTCAAIRFSGGAHSPLFPLLLLTTAFLASMFPSLTSAGILVAFSAAAYLLSVSLFSSLFRDDAQVICAQVIFLLLTSFFINRLGAESREQAQKKLKAMEELRMLSEMDRAASAFVSAVSFEMRTPLTSILGFSDMLVNRDWEPEKERMYIEIISREADNLSRLVEDLLDISRLESGKVNLNKEVTRLDQLLNMSLPLLEPACDPANVVMNISPDLPEILVDPPLMKRVFDAIFGYIVRKSGRGSEVRASAKMEGRQVVITFNIRNRAAARPEDGSRIFPPPGGKSEDDLELAMARRIILAHKGSLNLIQASGGWFAIVVRLPELVARDFTSVASTS